ncbi:sugar phosphate isomerase/epimerase family protein [Sporosarcina sp. FSL W7-1349]|uniref:sugar phosphate isomerase/epimerase family protein n=1 Tax=Sporosarcina sp. FSL W7-1349 TaxID=2921561 RepID=UPI0030F9F0BC
MRHSISTYTLFSEPIDEAIDRLIADGWKSIELMGEGAHHGRLLFDMDPARLTEISDRAKDKGVSFGLHLPISGFNPALADEETEAIWQQCLPVIESLDVKYVLLHPGENPSIEAGIESTARFAQKMLEDLPAKTDLVVENIPAMKNGIGVSIDQLISILHKINDHCAQMMLDTGHCYMNEREHFLAECEKAIPYLYGLHINDNHGEHDEHLQIGEGMIPFERLLLLLKEKEVEYVLETNTVERAEHSKREIMKFIQDDESGDN